MQVVTYMTTDTIIKRRVSRLLFHAKAVRYTLFGAALFSVLN
jgi:hypothetical protein